MAADPSTWLSDIINRLLNIVVWPIFVAVVFLMFIWAGILFVTAHGDPTKVSTAKKTVIWAVIGVVVGVLAFSAVETIKAILGL